MLRESKYFRLYMKIVAVCITGTTLFPKTCITIAQSVRSPRWREK